MDLRDEARIIGHYLINKNINEKAILLYEKAMQKLNLDITLKESKLLFICLKYPFLIGIIDSGLKYVDSKSVIHKKIFIMSAILESLPEYCEFYIPYKQSFIKAVKLFFIGIITIFKTVIGFIFLKIALHE